MLKRQHGDTIIEVMMAFVIFSLVVVSTLSIMNKGSALAQRSLELTLVRQQIDAQMTMLNYVHSYDTSAWNSLAAAATSTQPAPLSTYNTSSCPTATDLPNSFFLAKNDTGSGIAAYKPLSANNFADPLVYAHVDTFAKEKSTPYSYQIWVTLVQSEGFAANHAYDAHVRACWNSVGDTHPTTIATVARIYDTN